MIRKVQASNEVLHKLLGTIDTPEKFNAKRAQLAQNEWRRMKANDSRECRNCHNYDYMDYTEQGNRAAPALIVIRVLHTPCRKSISTLARGMKVLLRFPTAKSQRKKASKYLSFLVVPNPGHAPGLSFADRVCTQIV